MSAQPPVATPITSLSPSASPRERAKKILPSERLRFDKQLDILKAIASASVGGAGVSNKTVGDLVSLSESTVSLSNAFFTDMKMITKAEGGNAPSSEVIAYKRALEFTPETAGHQLAPLLRQSWFFQRLRPKLEFKAISDEEAITELAMEAEAGPHHKAQLRLLLDYLATGGLIVRDNGQVRLAPRRPGDSLDATPAPRAELEASKSNAGKSGEIGMGEGSIAYHIDITVTMSELAGWAPDRITAFFSGMAQVIAAKAKAQEAKP